MLFIVIGIAVVSAMLIIFIKQYRPEYSMLTAAIAGAVLTAAVIIEFSGLKDTLISLFELSGIDSELLVTVIKAMGFAILPDLHRISAGISVRPHLQVRSSLQVK